MRKQFDIELSGSKMTPEVFDYLSTNEMIGGIEHHHRNKVIVYGVGTYSNMVADMHAFKKWCKHMGLKVYSYYRNRQIQTGGGEYIAKVITYTF